MDRVAEALPAILTNVSTVERWISLAAGSCLLGYGGSAENGSR